MYVSSPMYNVWLSQTHYTYVLKGGLAEKIAEGELDLTSIVAATDNHPLMSSDGSSKRVITNKIILNKSDSQVSNYPFISGASCN